MYSEQQFFTMMQTPKAGLDVLLGMEELTTEKADTIRELGTKYVGIVNATVDEQKLKMSLGRFIFDLDEELANDTIKNIKEALSVKLPALREELSKYVDVDEIDAKLYPAVAEGPKEA